MTCAAAKRETDPKKRVVITGMGIVSVFGNDVDSFYDRVRGSRGDPALVREVLRSRVQRRSGSVAPRCRFIVSVWSGSCLGLALGRFGFRPAVHPLSSAPTAAPSPSFPPLPQLLAGESGIKTIDRFDITEFPTK